MNPFDMLKNFYFNKIDLYLALLEHILLLCYSVFVIQTGIIQFIFSLDSAKIDNFIQETGASNLTYILAPDEKGTLELCQGRFPTFFYLKNNNVIHKWDNNNIGYPAYDWIEDGLK